LVTTPRCPARVGVTVGAEHSVTDANHHRAAALVSVGIATASTVMMWLWKQ
jgi:hypothetical protein